MGIVRPFEAESAEIEDFRRMLLSSAVTRRAKDDGDGFQRRTSSTQQINEEEEKVVCVTSGVSYLAIAIVNHLLHRGYYVRVLVSDQDMEQLRAMEAINNNRGDHDELIMRSPAVAATTANDHVDRRISSANNNGTFCAVKFKLNDVRAVTADISMVECLMEAFDGCCGVFHTAAFVDPGGLSGYSKAMAGVEEKTCKNVIEACARTPSVKRCVLTSSLLACIWQESPNPNYAPTNSDDDDGGGTTTTANPVVINEDWWSNISLCHNKKLWYALGKLKAEKSAWMIAEERGLNLVTLCPGLITGPDFSNRNPTPSFAYLKGAREMYRNGLLAIVDANRLADAHVYVFEAMNGKNAAAFGRYICFDKVIQSMEELETLARDLGLHHPHMIIGADDTTSTTNFPVLELSNAKLSKLIIKCNH